MQIASLITTLLRLGWEIYSQYKKSLDKEGCHNEIKKLHTAIVAGNIIDINNKFNKLLQKTDTTGNPSADGSSAP
jgi:hypothetical protein